MKESQQDIEDYHSLILNGVPLLDVRAPIEFSVGHLPTSYNFPILSDDERVAIGTCYKLDGREKAIELGHQLVSGGNRESKIQLWRIFYETYPNAVLYCARGGMRSKLTQAWLKDIGIDIPRVHLGYKALRNHLLSAIESVAEHPMLIVSGNTGTGKTELLQEFNSTIDLEGLANHHGSAFGKNITPQPAQATFENALAVELIQKHQHPVWFLEDESRSIGKAYLPEALYQAKNDAPIVVVEETLAKRLERISQLYFDDMSKRYQDEYGEEEGWLEYCDYLISGLSAVKKRLGLVRYAELQKYLDRALIQQRKTSSVESHLAWLSPLLTEYYDPMYRYQIDKKKERVIFTGNYSNVCEFMRHYSEHK